jgi:hypothetical protein
VWFDTITGDISADCDFATFARLTVAAATARHGEGSEVVAAVRKAWDGVGVSVAVAAPGAPTSPTAPSAPTTPADQPAPSTAVNLRRTGGLAGRTIERTIVLDELPHADARAWRSLLDGERLPALADEAAGRRGIPDAFCYGVRCDVPPLDVQLPEMHLSDEVRGLFERTLATDDLDE